VRSTSPPATAALTPTALPNPLFPPDPLLVAAMGHSVAGAARARLQDILRRRALPMRAPKGF